MMKAPAIGQPSASHAYHRIRGAQFKLNPWRQRHFEGSFDQLANHERRKRKKHQRQPRPCLNRWTTAHIGTIHGGTAQNIMAKDCVFGIDFRVVPGEDGHDWEMRYREEVRRVEAAMQAVRPETSIKIETRASVPGLRPEENGAAETLARSLTGDNAHVVAMAPKQVSFRGGYSPVSVARATLHRRIRPMNSLHRTDG